MDLSPKQELVRTPLLRKRLQQLRGFERAFEENNRLTAAHLKIATKVDPRRLHQAFFNWVSAVEGLDHAEDIDRADRIVFLGGLALRELLRAKPVSVVQGVEAEPGAGAELTDETVRIARFWPEGFIYTNFCICSIAAVHEQEFGAPRPLAEIAHNLGAWWSFRENASEDVNFSIGYLDLFFGNEPNWMYPASPTGRRKGEAPQPALASPGIPKT